MQRILASGVGRPACLRAEGAGNADDGSGAEMYCAMYIRGAIPMGRREERTESVETRPHI